MSTARTGHSATTLNDGKVLVAGGQTNSSNYLKNVEIYNPGTNQWISADDMSVPRFGHTATLLPDGKVLVVGGVSEDVPLASAEIYDPVSGKWSSTDSMNSNRIYHIATLLNSGKVLVTGGASEIQGNFAVTNLTEIYDPVSSKWIPGPTLNSARIYHMATALSDGSVLVAGGISDLDNINNWLNSAEVLRVVPEPFLELPWDYENKLNNPQKVKQDFSEAALQINSHFDHTYPLLSSGLSEIAGHTSDITAYNNKLTDQGYSSHDGYDYGSPANINDGDPVLAAASGVATVILEKDSGGGGNVVKVDHGNGYQTWYEHLYSDSLATGKVIKGDKIGRVGHTGNCWVFGGHGERIYRTPACAHIHFGVFQDKNNDGNFNDNVPDGATDPFGWQSASPDPWENYSFLQNGIQRTGNKSYYLWKNKIDGLKKELTANAGVFNVGNYILDFPANGDLDGLTLEMQSAPSAKVSNSIVSVGSTMSVILKDPLGSLVTVLTKPMGISIDFSTMDISRFKPGTISIYSSTDNEHWVKENSFVDFLNKKVTTQVSHLTYFALMGERIDTIAPATTAQLSGSQEQANWFRSDVQITLNAADNTGGLGIDNTQYKIDTGDWQSYSASISATTEGHHKIEFYSEDKDGNVEDVKSIEFDVDKTAPEAKIQFNIQKQELEVLGTDNSGQVDIKSKDLAKNLEQTTITDKAGNKLVIEDREKESGPRVKFNIFSLSYNGTTYQQDKNRLVVKYKENKKDDIKEFEQRFEIKDTARIVLSFDQKKNQTTITQDKQKTEGDGIKILQLITEKGTLKYSY